MTLGWPQKVIVEKFRQDDVSEWHTPGWYVTPPDTEILKKRRLVEGETDIATVQKTENEFFKTRSSKNYPQFPAQW